jgi:hypothetical protein
MLAGWITKSARSMTSGRGCALREGDEKQR